VEQIGALEQQKDRLIKAGAGELLIDIESGTKDSRPNYQALQEIIRQEGDRLTIIVTRLDRLTRSLPELRRFVKLIEKTGTKLIALDDQLDLSNSSGRFHLNMLGALAEMEADRIGERTRHGHAFNRSQGKPPPGLPPLGYIRNGDRLEPDHEKVICFDGKEWSRWELGRLRVELILQHRSMYKAAREYNERLGLSLNKPGHRTGKLRVSMQGLGSWVTNPVLRGVFIYCRGTKNEQTKQGDFEAMLSDQEWEEVSEIIRRNNKKVGRGGSGRFLFSGLAKCGHCGGVFSGRQWLTKSGQVRVVYHCKKKLTGQCPNGDRLIEQDLTRAVIDQLKAKAKELWSLEQPTNQTTPNPEQTELTQQLTALKAIVPSSPIIDQTIMEIERQLLMAQQRQVNQSMETHQRRQEIIEIFGQDGFWEWLGQQKPDELRKVFRRYIAQVVITSQAIEVTLKI
jgi:hypothetical protein